MDRRRYLFKLLTRRAALDRDLEEEVREVRMGVMLDLWLKDMALACRGLRRNPGFTAVAVTMLALGIGVNAAVFTVVKAALFAEFPLVDRNDRLVYISHRGCCVSYPDFEDWRAQAKSFEGMALVSHVDPVRHARLLDSGTARDAC